MISPTSPMLFPTHDLSITPTHKLCITIPPFEKKIPVSYHNPDHIHIMPIKKKNIAIVSLI
jgi:hypothetical protein